MPDKCQEPCADLVRLENAMHKLQDQNSESHREIFQRLNSLEQSDAVQKEQYSTILSKLGALSAQVQALEAKPARRWESLVEKAVWAVCAAVIAFLLGRVGL